MAIQHKSRLITNDCSALYRRIRLIKLIGGGCLDNDIFYSINGDGILIVSSRFNIIIIDLLQIICRRIAPIFNTTKATKHYCVGKGRLLLSTIILLDGNISLHHKCSRHIRSILPCTILHIATSSSLFQSLLAKVKSSVARLTFTFSCLCSSHILTSNLLFNKWVVRHQVAFGAERVIFDTHQHLGSWGIQWFDLVSTSLVLLCNCTKETSMGRDVLVVVMN
ncbi:Uncharacterised protein [Chlamydia trachomatis]|nr:Uncharacterised protein [Chlamydia trachomatis]